MKFLFTITLNCVLLVLVSEAHPNRGSYLNHESYSKHESHPKHGSYPKHGSCPEAALRNLFEIEAKVKTQLCEIGKAIELVSCNKLSKKFYKVLHHLQEELAEILIYFLEHAEIEHGIIKLCAPNLNAATDKLVKIGEEAEPLEKDVHIAIEAQSEPHHHKYSGCGCKKSHKPSGCGCNKSHKHRSWGGKKSY